MKLQDFDFRLALTPEVMADIACDNKDCPCQTPLLYGEQARNHLRANLLYPLRNILTLSKSKPKCYFFQSSTFHIFCKITIAKL